MSRSYTWRTVTYTWRTVKTAPVRISGTLVLHSDDGSIGDYTHWYPLLRRLSKQYSDWRPYNAFCFCPAINSSLMGNAGKMTAEQVQELSKWTEILGHTRTHQAFGRFPTLAPAAAGQNRIDVPCAAIFRAGGTAVYSITGGGNTETFQVVENSGDLSPLEGHIIISGNLVNTYGTGSIVQITRASFDAEVQGCIDDLAALGIPVQSHVWCNHYGSDDWYSPDIVGWMSETVDSARGVLSTTVVNTPTTDRHRLYCAYGVFTDQQLTDLLDATAANDGVMIYYGHGETDATNLARLTWLCEQAMARGIDVTTHTKAMMRLYGS